MSQGFERIVVLLGAVEETKEALNTAAMIATPTTEINLVAPIDPEVAVVGPVGQFGSALETGPIVELADMQNAIDFLDHKMHEALRRSDLHPSLVSRRLLRGERYDTLFDYLEEDDLLVVGNRERGLLERLLHTSDAQKLVRTAPCPVLTVPEPAWN